MINPCHLCFHQELKSCASGKTSYLIVAGCALFSSLLDGSMLGLHDRLSCNGNSTEEYVNPGAHEESINVAKAGKMPCTDCNVQRRVDLQSFSIKNPRHNNHNAPNRTYSSGKTWCERDPGNKPSHYSSPVCAIFIVAITAAWIVHGFDVVLLLVHNPIVG